MEFNVVNIDGKAEFGGGLQWPCHNHVRKSDEYKIKVYFLTSYTVT